MSEQIPIPDTIELKKLNKWLLALVVFIVVWSVGLLLYVDQRVDHVRSTTPAIITVDTHSGKISNPAHMNLFPPAMQTKQTKELTNGNLSKPVYEQKQTYEVMDFVVINYFFINGLIAEKSGDEYVVLYKDHNHVLQKVTVPRTLLLSPTSYYGVSPAALIGD